MIRTAVLKLIFRISIAQFLLALSLSSSAQTASINAGTVNQQIDGFGGQTWQFGDSITGADNARFFTAASGIGLNIVRTANTWDGGVPDLPTLQAAVANGASVELSLQSPPCSLKHSYLELGENCSQSGDNGGQPDAFNDGTVSSNGTCFTSSQALSASYSAYATYIVDYIKTLQGAPNNLPITFLDVQNEPNLPGSSNSNGLGTCGWTTGAQFDAFIGTYLGPALANAGLGSIKIIFASNSNWFNFGSGGSTDYTSACLNDSTCAQYVSITAAHCYYASFPFNPPYSSYTPAAYALPASKGKHLWLSECSDNVNAYDPSMTEALLMATNMHYFLTSMQVSAYEWWELAYGTGGTGNYGLTDPSYNPSKLYYVMGNWSKFVHAGWVAIGATANPQSGVYVSAFENRSSGAFAIVAINTNSGSVTQPFSLSGLSTGSVTPYVTDPNNDLASQPAVAVANSSFTASLNGSSVTTFTGAGTAPPPPTNLTGTVIQ